VSFSSGTPINFGTLNPGATSTEQTLKVHNTGNVAGTLGVQGTNWLDSLSNSQMLVGNTKFSTTSGVPYSSKTALTLTGQNIGTLGTSSDLSTFWQLQTNLVSSTFHGLLTQTITYTTSC